VGPATEKADVLDLVAVLREEDLGGVWYALRSATGWHRDYSPTALETTSRTATPHPS
jgi:hypothetical protein